MQTLKQEIARPTTKNWVWWASNQRSLANFDQLLAIFCTRSVRIVWRARRQCLRGSQLISCWNNYPSLSHHRWRHCRAYRSDCCTKSPNLSRLHRLSRTRSTQSRACQQRWRRRSWRAATSLHHLLLDQGQVRACWWAALLRWGPAPACAAEQQTSIEFNGIKQEGVNPELTHLYCMWQLEEGLLQFNADFAVDARFSPLVHLEHPHTPSPPLLVGNKSFSRPCCHAFSMLFRPAPVKPIRQGYQAG